MKWRALLVLPLLAGSLAASGDDLPVRLPTVTADGVPRGLVTVTVPVPSELRGEDSVSFEVRSPSEIEVLGRRQGIAVAPGMPARPLVLTLRIPAGTEAGSYDGAEVHFRTSSNRILVVPISVRIGFVRDILLTGPREMRGLRLGDRVHLAYAISNAGNGPDTLQVDLLPPMGWPTRLAGPSIVVVPARARLDVSVLVTVPGTANLGDHPLTVTLRPITGGPAVSTLHTVLGVVGRAGETPGLLLRPTVAFASAAGNSIVHTGVTVEGPVADGVRLYLQAAPPMSGGVAAQGLATVGAMSTPFSAVLASDDLELAAGNVGAQLGDLAGVNLVGQGATLAYDNGRLRGRALAARALGSGRSDGALFGAAVSQPSALGRVGGAFSYLRESGIAGHERSLSSLSFDLTSHPVGSFVIASTVGLRATPVERGVGYGLAIAHETDTERGSVRFTHAPGGSAGYARATDEMQFDYAIELDPKWSVDVASQFAEDRGLVFERMRNTSWSFGTRYQPTTDLMLSLRGNDSWFEARSSDAAGGDFGAANREVMIGADWRIDGLGIAAEGALGSVGRTTELSTGALRRDVAPQRSFRLSAARALEHLGALDANLGVSATGSGVGLPGQSFSAGLRWSNLPLTVLDRSIRITTSLTHQQAGSLQSALIFRSLATVALPAGLELAVSAEQNPYYRSPSGRAAWIVAMRVSATSKVRSPESYGPPGVVFEDRNLNGTRDADEPGIAGVTVRRGDARTRTDALGQYRLPSNARGATRVEPASLPVGLLPHPLLNVAESERLDLPVLPTGSAELELVLAADADGRVPDVDLELAVVILRDRTGFEWVARKAGADRASFDGIPVGTYELIVNTSRLREPLRIEPTTVTVVAGAKQRFSVPLLRRTIRTFVPPASRGRTLGDAPPVREP